MKSKLLLCVAIFCYGCGNSTKEEKSVETTDQAASPRESADPTELEVVEEKDATGKVISSGYLLNGKKESSWVVYSATGIIKSLTTYVHDKKEGMYLEFGDNNNQLKKKCTYHNDVRHGEYREYNYGNIKEERFYQNGKQEGTTKVYYDTGKIMEEGLYKNGLRDGVSKWYDQEGKVTIEYEYKNGELIKK